MNRPAFFPSLSLATALLWALLSACGDDSTGSADPATGSASLLMKEPDDQTPIEGEIVVHQDPSGTVLATTTTDANGVASLDVTAGDMVTTRYQLAGRQMTTVVGVEPGDTLEFFRQPEVVPGEVTDHVVLTGDVPDPYDQLLYVSVCSQGAGLFVFPYSIEIFESCKPESGLLHALLETSLSSSRQSFAYWTDVPFDDSGTTTLDFTGRWRSDWQTVTCSLPSPDFEVEYPSRAFWNERDGRWFGNFETAFEEGGAGNASTATIRVPRGFPQFVAMQINLSGNDGNLRMTERVPLSGSTSSIAFTVEPPTVTAIEWDSSDPARPRLSWRVDARGMRGDAQRLALFWNSGGDNYVWVVILPPQARSFQFPELPESLALSRPPVPSVENGMMADIRFFEGSYTDGYDDYRRALSRRQRFEEEMGQVGFEVEVSTNFATPYGEINGAAVVRKTP